MSTVIKKLLNYFKTPVSAFNDAGERIESMRFSVPALRVGVLEYGAGQLQTGNAALEGKPVKLYYPPEAVSDEKFLKSLETAPVVVGGHDSTTNEQNKKIDGWAHSVFFDAAANAAMIAGVVKGAKEVAYIKGNLGSAGFGASAFVDIYDLRVENGVTLDGQEYNAVANELRATHVALAPHVRDPENKIKVINAVCVNAEGEMFVENSRDENYWFNETKKKVQALKADEDRRGLLKWLDEWEKSSSQNMRKEMAKSIEAQLKKVTGQNAFSGASDKRGTQIKRGDTVKHDRFGTGEVIAVDASTYSIPHITVEFNDGQFKGEKIYRPAAEFVKNSRDAIRLQYRTKEMAPNGWVDDGEVEGKDEAEKYIEGEAQRHPERIYRIKNFLATKNTIDINPVAFAAAVKNTVKAMNGSAAGKIVHHNGKAIKLTGEVVTKHGADWYVGYDETTGKEVVVSKETYDKVYGFNNVKNAVRGGSDADKDAAGKKDEMLKQKYLKQIIDLESALKFKKENNRPYAETEREVNRLKRLYTEYYG